ncbi:MAG TPA: ribonuclease R, partial [Roseimicrobium sp.]|nr:ribonuclease R [Roseimicrobium sp.]
MQDQLLEIIARKDYVPANIPELLGLLGLPQSRQQELQRVIRNLEQAGRLARIKGNRYIQPTEADLIPGRIRINRQGKGFLIPDDTNLKEIVIPENSTSTAMHEDRVLVRRDVRAKGLRTTGEGESTGVVIRVLERRRAQLVGTLQHSAKFLYVIPDDPRIPHDVYVSPPKDLG